jgi:hypothetical protein|tara:strand:- start:4275 stop:4955 length:681 start_codon:yes stop_codon:yes gene_type:complete
MLVNNMHIKTIADKIIKESQVNARDYVIADRIEDINQIYLEKVERAVQIGSTVPISAGEATSEEFTIAAGSNVFTRTIADVPIVRVDFKYSADGPFRAIKVDNFRLIGGIQEGEQTYFANEKQFFVEEGRVGILKVTYARGAVTLFTVADYELASAWPSPDHLPKTFHPLLFLYPAYDACRNKEVKDSLAARIERLDPLFFNHYSRNSAVDSEYVTDEMYNPGGHR